MRALQAAGSRAWLGSRGGTALESGCVEQGVPFVGGFRFGKGLARVLHLPGDARRLRDVCKELNLDVVHIHRTQEQVIARWALGSRKRPVLVRTWHRDPAVSAGPLRRRMAKSSAGHLCVALEHEQVLTQAQADCVRYLPPGVDTDRFRPRTERASAICRIGLIGRWKAGEDRGQRAFLEVLRRLSPATEWRGVLLGRGEDRAELEKLIAAHPHRDRISLEQTGDRFPEQVAALDMGLVFATGADGSSRPALEMMACGVPLLLADRPGLRELREGNDGVRVLSPDDSDAWAQACEAWLAAPSELLRAGAQVRRAAEAQHAMAVRGKRLMEFYTTLLGPASRP